MKKLHAGGKNTSILFRVVAEGNFIRNLHWISSSCILWLKTTFIYQCVSSSVNYYCAMKSATSLQMNVLLKDVLSLVIYIFLQYFQSYRISKNEICNMNKWWWYNMYLQRGKYTSRTGENIHNLICIIIWFSFLIFLISNFINYLYCKLKYFNLFYGFTKTYLLSQNLEKHNII